jgi:TonB-linked SusC/RagA family outer membrane protein
MAYFVSGGYFDQSGIIRESGYKRLSFRTNLDYQASKKVKFGNNFSITRAAVGRVRNERGNSTILNAISYSPTTPVYRDGKYAYNPSQGLDNPVARIEAPEFKTTNIRTIGNVFAEFRPLEGLLLRTTWGIDYLNIEEDYFLPPNTTLEGLSSKGQGLAETSRTLLWINENTATYSRTFAESHSFTILGGFSMQESQFRKIGAATSVFPGDQIPTLGAGAVKNNAFTSIEEYGIISYFGRFNYSFKEKYLLSATYRIDGSSRLSPGNRYNAFPAVSAGWRISEEGFMQGLSFIKDLKIRGSYGITGNQEGIGNYRSRGITRGGFNYNNQSGLAPQDAPNENLTWERTTQVDAGLDISLFNNRLTLIADYYYKETNDLIYPIVLPRSTGFFSYLINDGQMVNRGFEFQLTTQNIQRPFNWTTSINFALNRNKLIDLPVKQLNNGASIGGELTNIARVGGSLGSFYGYVVDGIFQSQEDIQSLNDGSPTGVYQRTGTAPGDIRFKDLNNDGVVNSEDRTIIGNAFPEFSGGLTNRLTYKGFDLNVVLQFSYGNDIFNYNRYINEGMVNLNNGAKSTLNRWQTPGQDTDIPRAIDSDPNANTRISTRWIEDGSFLRFKTATFAYSLPQAWIKRAGLTNVRLYVQGQNLLTFTNYSGFDPEVNSFSTDNNALGIDWGSYPQARTYTIGINLGF